MKELTDADRFLLFIAILDPKQNATTENLIKWFMNTTGWEENRVRSAFEVCVVKGHIDK